jgi:hypothetical protein
MPTNLSFYIVPQQIAVRVGDISSCYKTADGRYVMDSRLLKRIQPLDMTGVERISRNEALTLIAQGGFDSDSNKPKE